MMRSIIFIAVLFAVVGCQETPQQATNKNSDIPSTDNKGAEIYKTKCAMCHGADGKLGIGGAKKLTESQLDLASLKKQIKKGKGTMPPFEAQLSTEEIDAVADFVMGLRK
jgi:mono/diheme cytochrome c family protein